MISFLYLKRPTFYTRDFKEIEISRKISNNHNPPTYVQGFFISNSFKSPLVSALDTNWS